MTPNPLFNAETIAGVNAVGRDFRAKMLKLGQAFDASFAAVNAKMTAAVHAMQEARRDR